MLTQADGSVLEFVETPEADEWHQSQNARRQLNSSIAPASFTREALPPPPPPAGSPDR